ncbi:PSP1 domain protein [Aspergillus nomiae NRRL 13137]|uniref:PSP1 domain protein n=1 Tax=Aspergillus nomiae NRRL (strain ATCC 15546 / NRRL 13137 / CBS 260.88 / M93) TaxID=1509407 RepID=A0A0L1J881_ASPN3|nr:PSP1 domain protein [Aspergillus nomiae NRRL 13137]KNG87942.1 PSP1 domain protein [Aspergillus nomiae NRRL 13137]
MAAQANKPVQTTKSGTSSTPNATASVRLEKTHPGVRRSTPDSEALASSDDDVEHMQATSTSTIAPIPKPARRTSWLNEVPANIHRKASLTSTGPLSSGASNPTSPATDQSGWPSTSPVMSSSINWNHVGSGSFPWGTGIWNTESRKEPPPRLAEIVPSPTMSNPSTASNYFNDELLSPTTRTTSGESAIPFSIPLHPTPKTYRSQSYSVGQLDPEFLNLMANKPGATYSGVRSRNGGQFSALQHRSSRPSLLGELGHDPATLGRVREDDDGEDGSPNGSEHSFSNYASDQARTIEQLSRENALLRQAAGQMDSSFRDRAMSSASATGGYVVGTGAHNLHRIPGSVPEEADLAVEDLDEVGDIPGYNSIHGSTRRRFSEHSANLEKQFPPFTALENRALDNVRKAHWQTSLGFGSMADIPQSRRHSFADIPIRHGSISGESQVATTSRPGIGDREDSYVGVTEPSLSNAQGQNREYYRVHMAPRPEEHEMETEYLRARRFAESYFARDQALRVADAPSAVPASLHQAYTMPTVYARHQAGLAHSHQNQLLYIVTFKCHRADVFYIQEDTGLQVKPGDLVIVEADRGTDLGTIQHANVSMQRARELKQQYAEEHYKWLMMFSRQGQSGAASVISPSGGLSSRSAIGGMGPHGTHGVQESSADIKPKLIKRLAQNHEILTLRDKEGNEAKAKRVCQQKVAEHRLNMEILDAEFQMDWKKLTFYYFADSYINFNSLVTDLFKIYKTRIWMSAINPASFVTPPTAGLQPPNPLGYNTETQTDRSHHPESRAYGHARDGVDREAIANQMGALRTAYTESYQPFGQGLRQPESGLGSLATGDPFSPYPPAAYGGLESSYVDYATSPGTAAGPHIHQSPADWTRRFQGLSLGS